MLLSPHEIHYRVRQAIRLCGWLQHVMRLQAAHNHRQLLKNGAWALEDVHFAHVLVSAAPDWFKSHFSRAPFSHLMARRWFVESVVIRTMETYPPFLQSRHPSPSMWGGGYLRVT